MPLPTIKAGKSLYLDKLQQEIDTLRGQLQAAQNQLNQGWQLYSAGANENARATGYQPSQGLFPPPNAGPVMMMQGLSLITNAENLRNAYSNEFATASALFEKEKEREADGYYDTYLKDLRPQRPTQDGKGFEFFNPRTQETIDEKDAWILSYNNHFKKHPHDWKMRRQPPVNQLVRKLQSYALYGPTISAQHEFDAAIDHGIDKEAGAAYERINARPITPASAYKGNWLTHDEEVQRILSALSQATSGEERAKIVPVYFDWDKDASEEIEELTPLDETKILGAAPLRRSAISKENLPSGRFTAYSTRQPHKNKSVSAISKQEKQQPARRQRPFSDKNSRSLAAKPFATQRRDINDNRAF